MNILLTGHKGFIGTALYKTLAVNNNVHGIDLLKGDNLLDCEWPVDIDLVIHLAGKSGVRESINDPAAYWTNNIIASRRLFERYQNIRILYASSSSAYEPDLNPYAASKFCLEQLADRYPNTLGMRFHTVWSHQPRENMFFDKLFNGTLEYVTTHHRDFVHLHDVVDAIQLLIANTHVNGLLDIGTGVPIRIRDLVTDLPVRLNTPTEREWTCANIEKMKALGWKPKYSIEKDLTDTNLGAIINIITGEKTV
jgi:nucleoside-diphosphate-sugar epimerase|tara:strand:- start:776 stop:1531 length:756 start_codon:yes stop_codon:yes gene_type:complete